MIYLYSKFPCNVSSGANQIKLLPCVMFELQNVVNEECFIIAENCYPIVVNFYEIISLDKKHPSVEKIQIEKDVILFLCGVNISSPHFTRVTCGNLNFDLSVSQKIVLTINGENKLNEVLDVELNYSHFEQFGEVVIMYLKGERDFVIVVEGETVKFADFYDEINVDKETRYFMKKQFDLLNHGKVCKVENKKVETYLVYLDDSELNMKNEFVFLVFLDCFMVKNFKYCNNLLCEEIKQKDENNILKFFDEFDNYVPFKNYAVTFKKNTLAGVYRFEITNNVISNIIHL